MTNKRLADLEAAVRGKQLVRFTRTVEKGWVDGYVLAIDRKWFLLAIVSEDIRFNGFGCFRVCDICELQIPHPHAGFVDAALKKRGQRVPRRPRVSVASVGELLRSANQLFPLVTISCERAEPNACWIGRVMDVGRTWVSLLEILPGASWSTEPTDYRLSAITQVAFGGDYEDALYIVGGPPPGQSTAVRKTR